MNRYLFFFIIVLFIGCDKTEDNIFTQTPDERLKATADEYREALFSAPNGWFLAVDTKKDGAYRLWMSFEENERVGMLSDMDATFSKAGGDFCCSLYFFVAFESFASSFLDIRYL